MESSRLGLYCSNNFFNNFWYHSCQKMWKKHMKDIRLHNVQKLAAFEDLIFFYLSLLCFHHLLRYYREQL